MRRYPMKLLQAMFSEAPEALDPINVVRAARKLIRSMIDSVMLRVTDINKAIIAAPPIAMNDRLRRDATANNGLKRGFRAVRHNLRIDFALTLQESEDRSLATRSASAFTPDSPRTEVTFINFDFAAEGRDTFTFLSEALLQELPQSYNPPSSSIITLLEPYS
jgi:hypothetical protein